LGLIDFVVFVVVDNFSQINIKRVCASICIPLFGSIKEYYQMLSIKSNGLSQRHAGKTL
jgi:hypothetical protein